MFLILGKSEARVLRKKMFLQRKKSLLSTRIYSQQLWKKNKWLKKEALSDDNSIIPLPSDLLILLNWRKIKSRAGQVSNLESSDPKSDALSIAPRRSVAIGGNVLFITVIYSVCCFECDQLVPWISPRASETLGLRFESLKDYIFYSLREKRRHLPTTRDITEIFGMFHLFLACTTRVYFVTQNSYWILSKPWEVNENVF